MTDFPYAATQAARMLTEGLRTASLERGLSLRQIGKKLGYSQAVVLSHMAKGRVPIPLDRALDIAREVGMPAKQFLLAVLEQRHSQVDWGLITAAGDHFVDELESLAKKPLSALNAEQRHIMREVVCDPHPARRWLSLAELPTIEVLRKLRPAIRTEGLDAEDKEALRHSLGSR